MNSSRCANPLAPGLLADYWLEELPMTDEEQVEEHLFSCADCSGVLQGMVDLIKAIRELTRKGLVAVTVSESFLERLRGEGLNVRQYRVAPGGGVACTITDQDDLVISRLAADLTSAKRVDISQCDAEGNEQSRIRDVPLTGARNEVVFSQSTTVLRALGKQRLRLKLIAVDDSEERVLGEYTFDHTPSRS
ncbi:MAG TPA: zf-HC2 domain-containing protein [Terriglobia bacterium]|nr:zf-HC2 domain-containing protein [Terriglobia bacterium]